MKIVDFRRSVGPNVLRIKEVPKPTLRSHEIMIQVAAAGLNVYDTWRLQDIPFYRYGFSAQLGYECSGKVVAVGSDVIKFKKGDEVCAILYRGGAYAQFVVAPVFHVLRIPSGVSLVEAAALPEASRLIFYALSVLVNLIPGKTILEWKKSLNFAKRKERKSASTTKNEDFCKRVKAETGEKGVDIILDVSGRDHFQKNLDCLARCGSLVILGHKIGDQVDIDLSFLMKKDVSVIGADIANINYLDIKQLMSDAAAKFWPLIEAGHVKPMIGKIFTFTEATKAHRALEKSSIPGKLLLVPPEATACEIHSPKIQNR